MNAYISIYTFGNIGIGYQYPGFSHFLLVNISNMVNERWYLLQLGPLGECYEESDVSAASWLLWSNVFKLTFVCILTFTTTGYVL